MIRLVTLAFSILITTTLFAQVNYTANDQVVPYDGGFRPGANLGYYPGFSDTQLSDLLAGKPEVGNRGVGTKAVRPGLFDSFVSEYGYDARVETFQHYFDIDIKDNTVIVGFPAEEHQDPVFYCEDVQSQLFANMYEPIWDNGENGTPVNEENYYAVYLWNLVTTYKDYVKFWEIWNEPGFDYTGNTGYQEPGAEGNWWENNPDPCDYKLRAPIFHYVRLLRISWEIIKSIDESAYVCVSGTGYPSFLDAILRNTDNPLDGSTTDDYPMLGGAYFDVMGFHSYPHFDGSLREYSNDIQDFIYYRHSDAAADGINRTRAEMQEVLDVYGYEGDTYPEKLWTITECNLPRKEFNGYIGSVEAQRNFMIKVYVECEKNDFVQLNVYKTAEDETDETAYNEFDLMGLYPKLQVEEMYLNSANDSGIATRTATKMLFGKQYDPVKTEEMQMGEDIDGAAFMDDFGNYTYVVWAKTTIDMSEEASATYSFPTSWELNDVIKREWNYGENDISTIVSPTSIALTAAPIFLTEQAISASTLLGCAPLDVQFEDISNTGATSWEWEFVVDGVSTYSTLSNPSMIFETPGLHTVNLEAFGSNGELVTTQTGEINVIEPTSPLFSNQINGPIVSFSNESSVNSQNFYWDFGDGTTSTDPVPTHVYYETGVYTVTLTTNNICGDVTYEQTISVHAPSIYYVENSANEGVPAFTEPFRMGYNFGYYPGWTDQDVANIAAGNENLGIDGVGAKSLRTLIGEFFVNGWSYDVRLDAFQHYANLGIQDNILTLDFPDSLSVDSTEYCPGYPTKLFKNLYSEIWDEGENGTPINEENPYAVYVYNMVETYGDYVKYWEIVNAPDIDRTGELAYQPPGEPGNWWENNPEPCDYQLRAPIYHYIRTLRISYEIIKYLQPDDYVALSGIGFPAFLDAILRNTDNPADGSVALGYERSGGAYFDVLGIKSFPHFDGATSYYDLDAGGFAYERHSDAAAQGVSYSKTQFENVLQNYGYGVTLPQKEWIIAEANVPRLQFDNYLGGPEVQKNWLTKAYVEAVKSDIRQMNILSIAEREFSGNADSPFDAMGLYKRMEGISVGSQVVNEEGIAMRTTSQLLFNKEYDATQTTAMNLPEEVGGAAFVDANGVYTYVLWAKTDTDNSESNTATYSLPASFGHATLFKRDWDYGETDIITEISTIDIPLTTTAFFLTENNSTILSPLAAFSAEETTFCPEDEVQFTNMSTNAPETFFWELEGANPATSNEANPIVTYAESGNYPVSLTVTNEAGSHTSTLTNYIEIIAPPTATFSETQDGAWTTFDNQSEGSYYHNWQFGDGGVSTQNNPLHFYFENGEYEVRLVAFNDCFSDTLFQTIVVNAAASAGFNFDISTDCENPSISFSNASYSSPSSYYWDFGGGNPAFSTELNPDVTYAEGGTYEVSLTVENEFGMDTETAQIYVPGNINESITDTLCEGGTYEAGGELFDINNPIGVLELTTIAGCDSTINIALEFYENETIFLVENILAGESFTVGNSIYLDSGMYIDTLQTENGCDSIVHLDLSVLTSMEEISASSFDFKASPNPFSNAIHFQFELSESAEVDLVILDVLGREMLTIYQKEQKNRGIHSFGIQDTNFSSGVYFCQLRVGEVIEVLRLVKE